MASGNRVQPDQGPRVTLAEPSLSVVIACRNEADLLPLQLAALRAQEVTGWVETIVVDDGSTDGTAEVAEAQGDGLPGFRVLRTPGSNQAGACNIGIAASTAAAVVFLDGDDEVAPGYLAALQRALVDHPFVAARFDHDTLNPTWTPAHRLSVQVTGLRHLPLRPGPAAAGATLAARRGVLEAVGGFDESLNYGMDTDLCWRLALKGVPLTFVPDAVLRYRYRLTAPQTYRQWRGYGRGDATLDRRFGSDPAVRRLARFGVRSLYLVAQCRHLPHFGDPSVRRATARRAGHLMGSLQGMVAPRRYQGTAETLEPAR